MLCLIFSLQSESFSRQHIVLLLLLLCISVMPWIEYGLKWRLFVWYKYFYEMETRIKIFKASALWADAFYKSKCPSVRLSVCLSVCLFVCLFTFELPFNGLFAPTSRSRMSNIFRDSESLGKSNGKKWSYIWTFLFGSGLKSPRRKKVFFVVADFALQKFEFLRFGWFFSFFKKIGVLGILGPPGNHASRWIRDLWSKGVSLILAYF